MARTIRRQFREIAFVGGRFDEAAGLLDLDVLSELRVYREIVVETARGVARWSGPTPLKIPPPDFGKDFRLGVSGAIGEGSCRARLERVSPAGDCGAASERDEFDKAADLVEESLIALRDDQSIPISSTGRAMRAFMEWGKTLAPSESMVIGAPGESGAALNAKIRRRLRERMTNQNYFEGRKLTGKVTAVELRTVRKGGSFRIDLDHVGAVSGSFANGQKSIVIQALQSRDDARLKFRGWCEFSPSAKMLRIRRIEDCEIIQDSEYSPPESAAKSILRIFKDARDAVPGLTWDDVPNDYARNYKHYLYGHPKEGEE